MKTVGSYHRTEIELDPQKAWLRGKALDAMLGTVLPPYPRGVWRLTHAQMMQMDFQRQLQQAAKANPL